MIGDLSTTESTASFNRNVDLNWFDYLSKHRSQFLCLSSDIVLFVNTGLLMATIIFDANVKDNQWTKGHTYTFVAMAGISYFLGVILGNSICSSLIIKWTKKKLKHIAIGLFYIAGVLFIVVPNISMAVIIARILCGIATGFSYITYTVHGGEIVVPRLRGFILSSANVALAIGILFGVIILTVDTDTHKFPANRIFGIVLVFITALAQLLLYMYNIESPIFSLQKDDMEAAVRALMKLRCESMDSWDIRNTIQDYKSMLAEDQELNTSIFTEGNIKPLLLLTCTKILFTLSFNYPLNVIRIRTLDVIFDPHNVQTYAAITIAAIKVLAITLSIAFVDFFGRRRPLVISNIGTGSLSIILGITLWIHKQSATLEVVAGVTVILFELLSNIGITFISDVLMSEAFPITKKATSISFVVAIENTLQVILFLSTFAYIAKREFSETMLVPICLGSLILIFGLYILWKLPETNQLSLRESVKKFKNLNINDADGITYA